jgi:hypothetical protein
MDECLYALLLAQGNAEGAIRLEQLCSNPANTHEFDILCAHPFRGFQDEKKRARFQIDLR